MRAAGDIGLESPGRQSHPRGAEGTAACSGSQSPSPVCRVGLVTRDEPARLGRAATGAGALGLTRALDGNARAANRSCGLERRGPRRAPIQAGKHVRAPPGVGRTRPPAELTSSRQQGRGGRQREVSPNS